MIYQVKRYAKENEITINYGEEKTEMINPITALIESEIRQVESYEYLGVTLRVGYKGKIDSTYAHAGHRALCTRTKAA